jgi:predicted membrane channel-forming protein YqfA (hemolysin III family)
MTSDPCLARQRRGGWAEDLALNRCAFPIAPRNTVSNLAYAAVGLALFGHLETAASAVMAAAMLVLAGGSAAYHGLKTPVANTLDRVGMYAAFGALAAYAVAPAYPLVWVAMLVVSGVGAATLTAEANRVPGALTTHMGILLGFVSPGAFFRGAPLLGLLSLALFAVGYVAWKIDRREWLDRPDPLPRTGLWGHAIWHGATAAALAVMFLAQGGS